MFVFIFIFSMNLNVELYKIENINTTIIEIYNLEIDKFLHFFVTFILTIIIQIKLYKNNQQNIEIIKKKSFIIILLSIFKEIIDSKNINNKFSFADLFFDFIGILIGFLFFYLYIKRKSYKNNLLSTT